ncbi:AP-5 complex subunit sigma-1 [Spea bombifrons]|uniref:AP-5 complex subunit sigma-1 n=1 Tax=Spea bombifrons TaxID=233779 RepID=UPI002349C254|nr:AP-5 complex subunit sigma-1 [Spea bombifrons]
MVYAFVVHTLGPGPGGSPALSTVLYSRVFCCTALDEKLGPDGLEKARLRRKEQIWAVARQTESMCLLRRRASGRPPSDYVPHPDEPLSLREDDVGLYGLAAGDPFPREKSVLWAAVGSVGFSLICDAQDNLTLAESTLRTLAGLLADSLKLQAHGSNVLLRADRIEMTLDRFLPQGQLLFLSRQAAQALEKELAAAVTL